MDPFVHKLVSVSLFLLGLAWVIFTIFSSFGSECFNMLYAYITIFTLLIDSIWNNFIKPQEDE